MLFTRWFGLINSTTASYSYLSSLILCHDIIKSIVLKSDPVIDPVKWSGHGSDGLTRVNPKKIAFVFLMPNNKNNWRFRICNSHWLHFLPCETVFSTNQWAIIIEFLRAIIPVATRSENILTYHQEVGKKEEGRMTPFFIFFKYI